MMNAQSKLRLLTIGVVFLSLVAGCAQDQRWRSAMLEGNTALRSGDYTHAEQSFMAARKEAEVMDPQGKRLAETLSQLGQVNRELGRFPRAESLFQEALSIRERVYGPTHAETAASLTDLGELYRLQGLYTQAEALHVRAKEIR
jgi:tetratricopeptide (TPR) repeat protein